MNGRLFLKTCLLVLIMLLLGTASAFAGSNDIGAWYGTNNVYDFNDAQADGVGGSVQYTYDKCKKYKNGICTGGWETKTVNMSSRDDNAATVEDNHSANFTVLPDSANGYQIRFIKYGFRHGSKGSYYVNDWDWYDVTFSDPKVNVSFTISNVMSDYVIWVVFEKPGTQTYYSVTADVFQSVPNNGCNASTVYITGQNPDPINPQSAETSVLAGSNASFSFTPQSGCEIESYAINNGTFTAYSAYTFATSAINIDTSIVFKFRPVTYTITASVDSVSPSGSGTINPSGAVSVAKGADSEPFAMTPTTGYRVLNVRVTDPSAGYVNKDLGPIASYTFKSTSGNGSIIVTFAVNNTNSATYCQIPPFVQSQTQLTPNVLIIFDTSGSMADKAYSINNQSYSSTETYTGYFDPNKMYKLSSSTFSTSTVGLDKTASCSSVTKTPCSGNRLNFEHMRKVDIVRHVLVGGKVVNRAAATKQLHTDDNYYIDYGTSEPIGLIQTLADRVRFGLMVFNPNGSDIGNGDGGIIIADIGASKASLVSAIEGGQTDPGGFTPLGESLYEAIRYFEAKASAYNSGVDYSGKDPITYACQKHFVMLLTDGEPTNDQNLPGNTNATVTDSSFNVKTWNDKIPTADRSSWLPAVAYYAHNTDLRSSTVGKSPAIPGKQNLSIYTVYAFGNGTGTKTLQMAAKYGGYDDKNNDGIPDDAAEYDKNNDGTPDNYFEADRGDTLAASLNEAMSSILAKVASGTAASILSNSEGSGANILQAVFYPSKIFENQTEGYWLGELHSLWYYIDPFITNSSIREDTDYFKNYREPADVPNTVDADHSLNLKEDLAVNFKFDGTQTVADVSRDLDGDGIPDQVVNTFSPDEIKSIWLAGKKLWARTSARSVLTPCISPATCSGGLMSFSDTNKTTLKPYLQAADDNESAKVINYTLGVDQSGYPTKKVSMLTDQGVYGTHEWKLGDIISSTPKLQSTNRLNAYNLASPGGYNDKSYGDDGAQRGFTYSSSYKSRGMVYVGANDGMLHAFKLGQLDVKPSGLTKARLKGAGLGEEAWAFVPKHALPYLKYLPDTKLDQHIYYVDGTPVLADVSIGCSEADYWNCDKDFVNGSNWKTILVGGMGTGGASRETSSTCVDCVKTPITDPADATHTKGLGYSSYFALDVTNPNSPNLLWEFNDPELGFATTGPAIVKINAVGNDGKPLINKNGRWFAVFGSGPTGPLANSQFQGRSDQNLKLFVVDLKTGALVTTIDTLTDGSKLGNAFAGSITGATSDTDRWNKDAPGFYQDDALYIGYSQLSGTSWTGGVLRLMTGENLDPTTWKLSKVIDGVGPVTTNIARLQDRKNHNFWLYFGAGRYYASLDDEHDQRNVIGIKEPCYLSTDKLDPTCTTKKTLANLTSQNTSVNAISNQGWYVTLAPEDVPHSYSAERVITDPVALPNGNVFFTTFRPTSNVCSFGGKSYMWSMKYDTGGPPLCEGLKGKALVQVSTGSFEEIDLKQAFGSCTQADGTIYHNPTPPPVDPDRPAGWTPPPAAPTAPMTGKPPTEPPPIVSNSTLKPVKRIIHIKEN